MLLSGIVPLVRHDDLSFGGRGRTIGGQFSRARDVTHQNRTRAARCTLPRSARTHPSMLPLPTSTTMRGGTNLGLGARLGNGLSDKHESRLVRALLRLLLSKTTYFQQRLSGNIQSRRVTLSVCHPAACDLRPGSPVERCRDSTLQSANRSSEAPVWTLRSIRRRSDLSSERSRDLTATPDSDLNERWPCGDGEMVMFRAHDALEHLRNPSPVSPQEEFTFKNSGSV